jgi:hypothetical protein
VTQEFPARVFYSHPPVAGKFMAVEKKVIELSKLNPGKDYVVMKGRTQLWYKAGVLIKTMEENS